MKISINLLFFFFSLSIKIISLNQPTEKIIFAWQMNRHGARAPYLGVKNGLDAYMEQWTQIEELSEVGKRMLYLLGVKVRKRYVEEYRLLSEKYNPQEIYIRSTDVNRTIESIESFLQGLYPNGTGPTIENKTWQNRDIIYPPNKIYKNSFDNIINKYKLNENKWALPFGMSVQPVHLFYEPAHEFGLYDTKLCKGHKEIYENQTIREEVIDFGKELLNNFTFFQDLERVDRSNKTFMEDYWTIYKYMDGFICDEKDQRSFDYMRKTFSFNDTQKSLLYNASKLFLKMDYFDTNFPKGYDDIPIMANSYIMHSLVNWMEKAIEGNETNNKYIKYVIYSAHDSSIGALEHFMKYAFNITPKYADFAETRYFELYIDNNHKEKKVRYLNGQKDIIKDMTFDKFKEIINETTWTDQHVANYCQFETNNDDKKDDDKKDDDKKIDDKKNEDEQTIIISMIILAIINLVLILVLIVSCLQK